jgi:hypothetical protein
MSAAVAVAIHLAPELAPEFALRTLKSCEAALGAEQCRLTDETTSDDDFYAIVTSDREGVSAHIVLLRHGATQPTERDISFAPEDPPGDRWASVGVVIAALVTAESGRTPAPVHQRPLPPAPKPKPVAPPPPALHPLRIDVLAELARVTKPSYPAELGGVLRVALAPSRSPFFLSASGGYSARLAPQPDIAIVPIAAGGGYRWGKPDALWGAELHVDGLAEWWRLSAAEPGRSEWRGVWRFGGSAGMDGTWGFLPALQAVVGASVQVLAPQVDVAVRAQSVEWVPPVGAALIAGFRFVP